MFALFNLGCQELVILIVGGVMMVACSLFVLWMILRAKDEGKLDDEN